MTWWVYLLLKLLALTGILALVVHMMVGDRWR